MRILKSLSSTVVVIALNNAPALCAPVGPPSSSLMEAVTPHLRKPTLNELVDLITIVPLSSAEAQAVRSPNLLGRTPTGRLVFGRPAEPATGFDRLAPSSSSVAVQHEPSHAHSGYSEASTESSDLHVPPGRLVRDVAIRFGNRYWLADGVVLNRTPRVASSAHAA